MPAEGKKGSLVLALGLGKPKGGDSKGPPPSEPESDEDEAPDGKQAAAQEIMDAFKSGDTASLKESLESFISMCGDY
jgi:hypothetical protein